MLLNQMKTEAMEHDICKNEKEADLFSDYILNERSQAQVKICWNSHSLEQAYDKYQEWLEGQYNDFLIYRSEFKEIYLDEDLKNFDEVADYIRDNLLDATSLDIEKDLKDKFGLEVVQMDDYSLNVTDDLENSTNYMLIN